MKSPNKFARLTGIIGILVLITGTYSHSITSGLIVQGEPLLSSENILASATSFRFAFVSSLLMEIIFIFYALNLYRLLNHVNRHAALVMMIFVLIPVPIYLLNQLNQFALLFLSESGNTELFSFFLSLHKNGGFIVSVFFGLWLFPFGYLIFKSGFFPKILGIFLMIGCFGYLISFVQGTLFPGSEGGLWSNPALIVTHISELAMMLWLLAIGVNSDRWNESYSLSAVK